MKRTGFIMAVGALTLLGGQQLTAPVALAREFEIDGTLDCGLRSGRECAIANWNTQPMIAVITRDMAQQPQRVLIDISWIKNELDQFRQDGPVHLMVRDDLGPTLVADAVIRQVGTGTDNPGLSNGNRIVAEQGHGSKKKKNQT